MCIKHLLGKERERVRVRIVFIPENSRDFSGKEGGRRVKIHTSERERETVVDCSVIQSVMQRKCNYLWDNYKYDQI